MRTQAFEPGRERLIRPRRQVGICRRTAKLGEPMTEGQADALPPYFQAEAQTILGAIDTFVAV